MTKKETPNEKRLSQEAELDKSTKFGIDYRYGRQGMLSKALHGDGYGTSRSAGARAAGHGKTDEIWKNERVTIGEAIDDPRARKAMREAGAEERREARGMKKGGAVTAKRRGDGIAQRGRTKGRMI